MKFKINQKVFDKIPGLTVYVPIITGFTNQVESKISHEISSYVKKQEKLLRENFASVKDLTDDIRVKVYLDAFKNTGADTKKRLPTHLALAKRVVEGDSLPDISPVVNLYNAVSIKYLTPFGGEDLSTLYGDFELTLAEGTEHWLGINSAKPKSPHKGDLIWKDEYDVSTLTLNWRQCERTKITQNSTDGFFIMGWI